MSQDSLTSLILSMETSGYVGAPVVVTDESADQALTGSHRIAAANEIGILVDTITIGEIFEEAGLDFLAIYQDEEDGNIGETRWVEILAHLPGEIRAKYGIDLD
jgi:hypothetical protein